MAQFPLLLGRTNQDRNGPPQDSEREKFKDKTKEVLGRKQTKDRRWKSTQGYTISLRRSKSTRGARGLRHITQKTKKHSWRSGATPYHSEEQKALVALGDYSISLRRQKSNSGATPNHTEDKKAPGGYPIPLIRQKSNLGAVPYHAEDKKETEDYVTSRRKWGKDSEAMPYHTWVEKALGSYTMSHRR